MNEKRIIEIFSADSPLCKDAIELVYRLAEPSDEVIILSIHEAEVLVRARKLGIRTVPAVVVDGKLLDNCVNCGPDENSLRLAGVGQPK